MDATLPREKVRRPDLAGSDALACHHCRRHRVVWSGFYWVCTRLTADPDTGDEGCGRQFIPEIFGAPPA